MDAEEGTDAVARSVAEIPLGGPEGAAGEDIELAACGPRREYGLRQLDMAFHHQRVILPFERRAGAERDRPGQIRRSEEVLPA